MTIEEAIADIRDNIKPVVGGKSLDMAIQALTSISELSKSLKAVNRYEMDEKVLIGFNMAVGIFNKCFGESCALKNEQTEKEDTAELQVELEGDGYYDGELVYDFGKCPNCGWDFEEGDKDWEQPYCCHCGQKLHWFD